MLALAERAAATGLPARYVRGNAEDLPFRDGWFDAGRAERVFQYVARPDRAIAEIARVIRPGGRILINDPDHESLVIDHPAPDLWRRVKAFRTDVTRPNGRGAHQLRRLFKEAGLADITVDVRTLQVSSLAEAFDCQTWGRRAVSYGAISESECAIWESGLAEMDAGGNFTYAMNYYSVAGTKAAA